uniref:Uncharacterized protein n=1 Tax=Anguilla anguilla TaxID=7936 RepID=A0A0E9WGW2_ANGAN
MLREHISINVKRALGPTAESQEISHVLHMSPPRCIFCDITEANDYVTMLSPG